MALDVPNQSSSVSQAMALGSSTNSSARSSARSLGTARSQPVEDLAPASGEPPATLQAPQPLAQPLAQVVPTTAVQFIVILIALIFAIFCVALDNTIIVTAIPRITDGYRTLNDVGW